MSIVISYNVYDVSERLLRLYGGGGGDCVVVMLWEALIFTKKNNSDIAIKPMITIKKSNIDSVLLK